MAEVCLIVAGAPTCYIPQGLMSADFVIACDFGYKHAVDAGIIPDLIIGDFDSLPGGAPSGPNVISASADKDDTDTMLALKEALKRGYRKIVVAGGLGGRIDHEIANLSLSAYAADHGARCFLVNEHHQIFAIRNTSCRIRKGRWTKISVFAMDRNVKGVTLKGLRYPLTDEDLTNIFPVGVSNSFAADTAEITVREGMLLVVLNDLAF